MSNGCPTISIAPGQPGVAPAAWGAAVTLFTTDLVNNFAAQRAGSQVSLICSDGTTLAANLMIQLWSPQAIIVTLPLQGTVPACAGAANHELSIHIPAGPLNVPPAHDCAVAIDILNIPLPPPPPTLADLTSIAKAFHISVSQPPGTLQIGQPVRASLVPPLTQGLNFIGVDGVPLISTLTQGLAFGMMQKMTKAMIGPAGTVAPSVRTHMAARSYGAPGGKRNRAATAASRSGRRVPAGADLAPVPGLIVNVEVRWTLSAFSLFVGTVEMAEGSVFVLVDPDDPLHGLKPTLSSSVLGILLQPWVRELTTPPQDPARVVALFFLTAKIRLTAGQVTTDWIELPLAQVPAPIMDLPTVLVLFEDVNFARRALVCVPGNSLFSSVGPLRDVLKLIRDALQPLATLKNVAGWLPGLNLLIDKLPIDAGTTLAIADDQGRVNLEDQVIGNEVIAGVSLWDIDWEDKVSSLLFVGPMGKTAECFSAPGWSDSEGWYTVDLDIELAVLVPSLTSKTPASVPIGALTVVKDSTDDDFDNRMSSLKLV